MEYLLGTLTVLYISYLLFAGFGNRSILGTWPMFSRTCACHLYLYEVGRGGSRAPHNPWRYLIHGDPGMTPAILRLYLQFLKEIHGLEVEGVVEIVDSGEGSRAVYVSDLTDVLD